MGNQLEREETKKDTVPTDAADMLKKRRTVADEVLSTEESYVKNLQILLELYIRPLEEGKVLASSKVEGIFANCASLYEVHRGFLHELQERMRLWSDKQKIGDVFVAHADMFKSYTTYVNNYNNAMDTLNELQHSKSFQKFLLEAQSHPSCQRLDLPSLLIMPIQRLPRYVMLIAELKKRTPKKHRDYKPLCKAEAAIGEVTTFINEEKRRAEQLNEILIIQNSFPANDVQQRVLAPQRHLLAQLSSQYRKVKVAAEGSSKGVGTWKSGKVFLFNDALVLAKSVSSTFMGASMFNRKGGALKIVGSAHLPKVNLFEMDSSGPGMRNEFDVLKLTKSSEEHVLLLELPLDHGSFHLKLTSEEEMVECVKQFHTAKSKARKVPFVVIWERPAKKEKKGSARAKSPSRLKEKGKSAVKKEDPKKKSISAPPKKRETRPPVKRSKSSDGKKSLLSQPWGADAGKKKKKKPKDSHSINPVGAMRKKGEAAKEGVARKVDGAKRGAAKGKDKVQEKTPLLGRKKKKKVCGCCVVS